MSVDDRAEQAEQLFRDIALATKHPELKPTGSCYNCAATCHGCYCDSDCREDHEQRERFNKGRL